MWQNWSPAANALLAAASTLVMLVAFNKAEAAGLKTTSATFFDILQAAYLLLSHLIASFGIIGGLNVTSVAGCRKEKLASFEEGVATATALGSHGSTSMGKQPSISIHKH